jgi:anti-sigma regulatory factor (Ser/Thr protein kinase)
MSGAAEWSMVRADAREALSARRAVRQFLALQADRCSDLDAVETIVGELVANVIRHASGPIGIHVAWEGDGAVAVVADRGPGIPVLRSVPGVDATCGRGLMIVHALAKRVEISARKGAGSRVIVELPVHRGLPLPATIPAPTVRLRRTSPPAPRLHP